VPLGVAESPKAGVSSSEAVVVVGFDKKDEEL